MYISSFSLESFGIFTSAQVSGLSSGLNIFYGANGSGKTTCIDFLRSLLCGQPRLSSLRAYGIDDKKPAGALELAWPIGGTQTPICKIAEDQSTGRQLTCNIPEYIDNFLNILSMLSADEYRKIFGFGLAELEKFADSPADKANAMLYAASFGSGLRSPSSAINELNHKMAQIWGNNEDATSLSGLLNDLEKARNELGELETVRQSNDNMASELLETKKALSVMRERKSALAKDKRLLQKKLDVWRYWDEWRKIRKHEDALADAPDTFPTDGVKRLELIIVSRNSCEQQLAAREARISMLVTEREKLVCDSAIMNLLPRLRRLSERKASFDSALGQMEGLHEKYDSLSNELAETLERLGSNWSCDRIRSMDRSLFAREKLEQLAEELTAAREAHHAAIAALSASNQEVTATEQALTTAGTALANLPDPTSELNAREREELQTNNARLKECRRQNQAREKNLENARHALIRALEQASLPATFKDGAIDLEAARQAIESLLHARQEALEISSELQKHASEAKLANERLTVLESNADNIRKKMEESRTARRQGGISENSIDKRTRALHTLRSNVAKIENAREKLDDIDDRIAEAPKKSKSFRHLLIWPGILVALAGCALFAACHFWQLNELKLADFSLPLSLPFSYLIVALGVVMLGIGLPAKRNANKAASSQLERLMTARESGMMEIAVLDRENRDLAMQAGVENTDPITLDAAEMLLEREKEQRIHEERSKKELDTLNLELEHALSQIRNVQQDIVSQENEIQKCRKKWQDLLARVKIAGSPSPESAATVFARVEACQIALENVRNAENELNELWEDLHLLESAISSMPAVAARLENAGGAISLEEAVRLVLESCKNSDKMWEDKLQARSAIQTVENELEKARARQEEAAKRLEEANARQDEARENWRKHTIEFGSGDQPDPQTLREALRLMDKCLATESALEGVKRLIEQNEAEIADMEKSLSALLAELSLNPLMKDDKTTDWLTTLDDLLGRAEHNVEIATEQKRLDSLIASHKEDLAAAHAEMASIESRETNLLDQANAADREQFLNLAEKYTEKQKLITQRQELEAMLRQAAGDAPFDDFLASFSDQDPAEAEEQLETTQKELDQLVDEDQKLANSMGILTAKIGGLDDNDDLSLLRQRTTLLSSALQSKMRSWCKYAFAKKLLTEAIEVFEKNRQPPIAQQASSWFAQLTGHKWEGLRISLENREVNLTTNTGKQKNPALVNRSLKELAWLSLRFSFIQEFAVKNSSLPVLMDEVLPNFDPENLKRILEFLAKFANTETMQHQQVLYFTCRPELVEMFRTIATDARFFKIEQGKIIAA